MDRQGIFKGDLGLVQRIALMWLMAKEIDEAAELEKLKVQTAALSNHPSTQSDFLKRIFDMDKEEPEEFDEQNIEWNTPQTEEELEELNRLLDGI